MCSALPLSGKNANVLTAVMRMQSHDDWDKSWITQPSPYGSVGHLM